MQEGVDKHPDYAESGGELEPAGCLVTIVIVFFDGVGNARFLCFSIVIGPPFVFHVDPGYLVIPKQIANGKEELRAIGKNHECGESVRLRISVVRVSWHD